MGRRRLNRVSGIRETRPIFLIATEGRRTEPNYLNLKLFKPPETSVITRLLPTRSSSSPIAVLKRMQKYVRDCELREKDELWLVIDKNQWRVEDLDALFDWTKLDDNRNLAVSNPKFEYWLLLHFEDGTGVRNPSECSDRLKHHCPNFSKNSIPVRRITKEKVQDAIRRARLKDSPPCEKWPVVYGTTVYRMVERIVR